MLTQRKRFNYMVNNGHRQSSQKKYYGNTYNSALKNSVVQFPDQHVSNFRNTGREDKENHKKVQELQYVNKKVMEQTTKQFKKLEQDVQRVEKILEEKQQVIEKNKTQTLELKEQVEKVTEEKKILIEAIFEKDLVIKEYEAKLKQMIEQSAAQQVATPQKVQTVEYEEGSMQTDPLPQSCSIEKMSALQQQNYELEDQVFQLKEDLFDATNKVKLLTQQFEAFKILKQIETIQQS